MLQIPTILLNYKSIKRAGQKISHVFMMRFITLMMIINLHFLQLDYSIHDIC